MTKNGRKNGTALAKIGEQEFAILKPGTTDIQSALKANVGDEPLTRFDLEQVTIPAGGAMAWTIPTVDGEKQLESFTGVIVWHTKVLQYWKEDYGNGDSNVPPDCSSEDLDNGIGEPGGNCHQCPLALFDSATTGSGKACSERKLMYVIRPDSFVPLLLNLSPTNLVPSKQYLLKRSYEGKKFFEILTKFSLEKPKKKGKFDYSIVKLEKVANLDPDQASMFKKVAESFGYRDPEETSTPY